MFLRTIREDQWTIYEVCESDGKSSFLAWCSSLNKKYEGSLNRLLAIINQVATSPRGPTLLPVEISHEVNRKESIYEFIAGDLRLFWFYSKYERRVIVCGCQHIKKGAKANKEKVSQSIRYKKQYIKSYQTDNITYYQEGE